MAGVNEGHRQRLRERMMKEGLDGFQDHEILELLLFQFIPRKDTNKLAHDLLLSFGNLANIFNATPDQLMTVKGVSEVTACNLAMLKEVWRRYKRSEQDKMSLDKLASIIKYSRMLVAESYVERLVVVYVDAGTCFLFSEEFGSGNTQNVNVDIKNIVSTAVRLDASGVLLFHCHVQGNCQPSEDDLSFTEKLIFALGGLDIVVLEHIIFNGDGEFFSMFKEGSMKPMVEKYKQTLRLKR